MLRRRAQQGSCWAGLDFNRGPARCAGPLRRKNPKKPRRGFVAHDFGTKVECVIPLCSRGRLRGAVPPWFSDNKVPLQGSISDKERLTVCA